MLSRIVRRSVSGLSSRPVPLAARCMQKSVLGLNSSAPSSSTTTVAATTLTRWNSNERTVKPKAPEITIVSSAEAGPRVTAKHSERSTVITFPNLWLRDNCQCSACVNQDTRQRNFDTFKLPDVQPQRLAEQETHLEVEWNDGHTSIHSWDFLRCWSMAPLPKVFPLYYKRHVWGSDIAETPPKVDYRQGAEQVMADLTKNIWVYGFCLVENAEPTPEATEAFLKKIGPIRNTHYGGFYDFIPDLAMADTAYTNIALPAHTDTTYFSEPAGLQAFHCLSHEAPPDHNPDEPLGGESLLVDGFNAARIMKKESRHLYDVLKRTTIPWHASGNEGIAIAPDRPYPVLEIERSTGNLQRIRWNNDDRGVVHVNDAEKWYQAAQLWNEIIRRKTSEYWFKLTPGTILIFNNWRVMHGRSEFKGTRRICGAYIPRDDFVSRYMESNFEHDTVIENNLNQSRRYGSRGRRAQRYGPRRRAESVAEGHDQRPDTKSQSTST